MFWALLCITLILTLFLAYILKSADIEAIKGSWGKRRCEPNILFTGYLYKPTDDPRSKAKFMSDNFNFCIESIITDVLKAAFTPFLKVVTHNVGGLDVINGSLNSIRKMVKNGVDGFTKIINVTMKRFKTVMYNFIEVWHRMNFITQKSMAIALSGIYAGISYLVAFQNLYDFVVKVVIIILSILVALIFLLFFILIPVMPVIFTVISVLVGAGLGSAVGGMSSTFCVDPNALVVMADGQEKPLKDCIIGDKIMSRVDGKINTIDGILYCNGQGEDCVSIDGVQMSGSHRVLYNDSYVLARNHPDAKSAEKKDRLICLNTSTHDVPMKGESRIVWVGDWEEVDDNAGRQAWLDIVYEFLNESMNTHTHNPTSIPLLSPHMIVKEHSRGYIQIGSVCIGDFLLDDSGTFTEVLATYTGLLHGSTNEKFWFSDGVWVYNETDALWNTCIHGSVKETKTENILHGINIVSESGTFIVRHHGSNILIRDFTEMGITNIEKSYDFLDEFINKKK